MKTVILCGGVGYRLKEETEFKPKPMVLIGGKPILWHIMKIYAHYGFNEFIIALGYKGDYIKQYFLNQKFYANNFTLYTKSGHTKLHRNINNTQDNFQITFVNTGEDTLPGERILRIKDFIPEQDKEFMVTYGDGVANVDIPALVALHKKQNTIGTITGVHPRSKYGLLKTDNEFHVNKFVEKPVLDEWVNGGFMIFNKKIFQYIKENEMEHEALKRLSTENELSLYNHTGFWQAMDTYSDVKTLNALWNNNPEWKVWKD